MQDGVIERKMFKKQVIVPIYMFLAYIIVEFLECHFQEVNSILLTDSYHTTIYDMWHVSL